MDYSSEIAELLSRHGFRRFMMSRTKVGHLQLVGHLDGRPIDIVVDTGQPGAPAAGAGGSAVSKVYTLGDVRLTLEGLPVRSDGIFAIDMTHTNYKLMMKGV